MSDNAKALIGTQKATEKQFLDLIKQVSPEIVQKYAPQGTNNIILTMLVVDLRTQSGTLTRQFVKLCFLPTASNDETANNAQSADITATQMN